MYLYFNKSAAADSVLFQSEFQPNSALQSVFFFFLEIIEAKFSQKFLICNLLTTWTNFIFLKGFIHQKVTQACVTFEE